MVGIKAERFMVFGPVAKAKKIVSGYLSYRDFEPVLELVYRSINRKKPLLFAEKRHTLPTH